MLRTLHGDKAVWKIVDYEPIERVARIRVATGRPLDVDTWEDYVEVCERFGQQAPASRNPLISSAE